jgi:type II secretory pathway pseudopilin PulG
MNLRLPNHNERSSGYTVLEIIVAFFIFGCISAAAFNLIAQTERIRARALFVESATRIAADEAEHLKSIAACGTELEDSSYSVNHSGRALSVKRTIIKTDSIASILPRAREPHLVEISVNAAGNSPADTSALRFKMLVGQDSP